MAQLTPKGVRLMLENAKVPIRLQVIALKTLEGKQGAARYRALFSDGEEAVSVIFATQLAHLVGNGDVKEGTILEVQEYFQQQQNAKSVILILNVMILQQGVPRIGTPITVSTTTPATGAPAGAPHNGPPQVHAQNGGAAYGAPPHQQQQAPTGQPPLNMYGAPPPANYGAPPQAAAPNGYGAPPPPQNGTNAMGARGGYGGGLPPQNQPQAYPPAQPPSNPYAAAPAPAMQQHDGNGAAYGAPNYAHAGAPKPGGADLAAQYRPAPGGAIFRNEAPPNLMPIAALNSYQNRWTVKARVTQKSDIRRYSNAKGEGKFFSFDLLDADGGEIRVVGWNEQCDRFFEQVQQGQIYLLSRASLRSKRGNFNQTRHQLEIHLETSSVLEPVPDEGAIPTISFNFVPLSQVEDTPAGIMVDVIAIVETVADSTDITRRDGTQVTKRGVNIRDASGRSIEFTLWDQFAQTPGDQLAAAVANGQHPVIAIKNARVGDFNGKTLSSGSSSSVVVDPMDIPEAANVRAWFDNGGAMQAPQALSSRGGGGRLDRRICIGQIKGERLGLSPDGKPDYVQTVGIFNYIKSENFCYPACPLQYNGRPCNKKLVDQNGEGMWYCERCGAQAPAPDWRYIMSLQFSDHTDCQWATCFNESGQEVTGHAAGELKNWALEDVARHDQVFQDLNFKEMKLKLKVSEDTYNEEKRLRVNLIKAEPLDYVTETKNVFEGIRRLERGEQAFPPLAAQPGATAVAQPGFGAPQGGYGAPPSYGGASMGGGYGAPPQMQQAWAQAPSAAPQHGGGGAYGGGGYGAPAATGVVPMAYGTAPPPRYEPYGQGGGWGA